MKDILNYVCESLQIGLSLAGASAAKYKKEIYKKF
jgi:hypothetical protein